MLKLVLNSALLGIGLAMDACAVSMANGMNEPKMKIGKTTLIAFLFALFQAMMPMIGWVCVHFVAQQFAVVEKAIPYIALVLLCFIGGKMLFEGIKDVGADKKANTTTPSDTDEQATTVKKLTLATLLTQAVATSIDALSVGFTISQYNVWEALLCAGIIAVITFAICFGAVFIGKKFGAKLGHKAEIIGGVILIAIGLEIFISSFF